MADLPPDGPRIEVSVVPDSSPYLKAVKAAALASGAIYTSSALATPNDVASRVLVVDLTRVLAANRLGPRVIAISEDTTLDSYDVIHPDDVAHRLPRALKNLIESETLRSRIQAEYDTINVLNQIGYALSAITDRHQLLDEVLTHSRRLLCADGGTIYLVEGTTLRFVASQNDTIPFFASRGVLPIDDTSLAGFVANRGTPLNIPDVRALPENTAYKPNMSFDAQTGYQTRSMLLVPLHDRNGNVIGVLAMVNRKQVPGVAIASFDRVLPFTERHVGLARSIASQAAVALENWRLYRDIQNLFQGFVEASVSAIEARDPSTGGHSWRVAELTTLLAREVSENQDGPFSAVRFSPAQLTELHFAAMLHDFGKVGVREEVLLKASRLYPWEMNEVDLRFRLAALEAVLQSVKEEFSEADLTDRLTQIDEDLAFIQLMNRAGSREDHEISRIRVIGDRWHLQNIGERALTPRHVSRLCVPYGTLDYAERLEIERHVEHTWQFLKRIPWTRDLKQIPDLAYAHHEKLDGTGYPRKLSGDAIPWGARLMTVADIYDALTASDRPYKGAMTPEEAVVILKEEAGRGRIELPVIELLEGRRLWRRLKGRVPM
ncbi:MAG: GAF domain-containing protein [Myxococcales bacterium]|nr:GAF domain-containing protein [Myxococcales bacterium]